MIEPDFTIFDPSESDSFDEGANKPINLKRIIICSVVGLGVLIIGSTVFIYFNNKRAISLIKKKDNTPEKTLVKTQKEEVTETKV